MPLGECGQRGRQPPQEPGDGSFKVEVVDGGHLKITQVNWAGKAQRHVVLSEHNIWALIGILCLFVGLSLPKHIGKKILIFTRPPPRGSRRAS